MLNSSLPVYVINDMVGGLKSFVFVVNDTSLVELIIYKKEDSW